ncbi:hypothetical protein Lal_00022248 [Lupinus albus]|nr:hypothetical protein Lal_00022248 [Lupinus albus]
MEYIVISIIVFVGNRISLPLPQPCIKGDAIAIKIPEADYQDGLKWCKNHLHGRVILVKRDTPFRFADLKFKLHSLWLMIGKWNMISLGRGFYDFSFASLEDMRMVCSVGSWSLKPGILRLSLWSPNFNPNKQKMSHSQCWIKLMGLPLEYWSPKVIFSIAGGVRTPIALDEATTNRTFCHFAKVLVEVNLKESLLEQILVEREGFAFFVSIKYEKLPEFCKGCQTIGHLVTNCRKNVKKYSTDENKSNKKAQTRKSKPIKENELVINLEIENIANLEEMERLEITPTRDKAAAELNEIRMGDSTKEPPITVDPVIQGEIDLRKNNQEALLILQENVIITDNITNNLIAKDMETVGRFWADRDDEQESEDEYIEEVQPIMLVNIGPWCCIGDFNVVIGAHECRSSTPPVRLPIEEFKHFIERKDWIEVFAMTIGCMLGIKSLVVLYQADRKLSLIAGPNIIHPHSHVLYADDVLIFCKGIKRNLDHLKSLLSDYAQASGQHINLQKSKFYTCNASPRKVVTLCFILGFNAGHLPFNYLGIPLFKGKPKRVHLQPIADRLLQKLAN